VAVLWSLGGTLDVHVGNAHVVIPGFLLVAVVLYALFASGSMVLIGRRLVPASEAKNQTEAE
jgi:vitamin B12/bleomycin/antimicrobial peptide transport system ATP-binding/permease protein